MLFWEEPVVSAFVRACAAAFARVEIDHVHVHTGLPPHTSNLFLSVVFSALAAQAWAKELYFALIDIQLDGVRPCLRQ